jgi:peptidoglycan hydrolase-like protein with peptidoglycan-binding domain
VVIRELKFGMVGDDVRDVKNGLCRLGYMETERDVGFFSPSMTFAVRQFQSNKRKEYGLKVTGMVNEETRRAISAELAKEG